MFQHVECEQGTDEWFKARLGIWSASNFSKVITPTGKKSTQSSGENEKLIAEILLGEYEETFKSSAMIRGNELESEAVDSINFVKGLNLESCGFLKSEHGYGCSPDAIDFRNGIGAEIKVPLAKTHVGYVLKGVIPGEYYAQVQGSMLVTGFAKWIFCSYHPLIKPLMIEVRRDDEYIDLLKKYLIENCEYVKEKVNELKK